MEGQAKSLSTLNVLAGAWLVIAPFILSYTSAGNKWQEVIFGIIVGVLGIIRLTTADITWPSWINALIGLWLILAPWVIPNTATAARWNEVIFGIIVAILAYSSGTLTITNSHRTQQQH